jgi:hypothetical protein
MIDARGEAEIVIDNDAVAAELRAEAACRGLSAPALRRVINDRAGREIAHNDMYVSRRLRGEVTLYHPPRDERIDDDLRTMAEALGLTAEELVERARRTARGNPEAPASTT